MELIIKNLTLTSVTCAKAFFAASVASISAAGHDMECPLVAASKINDSAVEEYWVASRNYSG
jgi:hypothetical protein